jgi:hypothetical protein
MSQIMRLRVILDTEEDVFRDIEIAVGAPLMHLHFAVLDAFGWEAGELASFFQSDESWSRGREFSLLDMSDPMMDVENDDDNTGDASHKDRQMTQHTVGDLIPGLGARAIYVYDFLRMWCFYVEPLQDGQADPEATYPLLCHEFGTPPAFDSKDVDLLMGMDLDLGENDEDDGPYRTGDPELDAYLDGDDDEDDYGGDGHMSIDDLDDLY